MDTNDNLDSPLTTGSSSPSGATTSNNSSGSLPPPQFFEKDPAAVSDELRAAILPEYSTKLEAIFNSVPWIQQNQPLDVKLIKALLHKVQTGPSQFECPFQLNGWCTEQDDHATKATEHVEEHLGHRGFVCHSCHMTFRRAYERDNHHTSLHNPPPLTPCPRCGRELTLKSLARHLNQYCPMRDP